MLLLRRVRPHSSGPYTARGQRDYPPRLPSIEGVAQGAPDDPTQAPETEVAQGTSSSSTAPAFTDPTLSRIEDCLISLQRSYDQKLATHCTASETCEVKEKADLHDQDFKSCGRAAGYLRDLRAVLRLIGPALPSAARLIEASIKGLVLALAETVKLEERRANTAEAKIAEMASDSKALEALKQEFTALKAEHNTTDAQWLLREKKAEDEVAALKEKIEDLKVELLRCTPETGAVEQMTGLMEACNRLMEDIEIGCSEQSDILENLSKYTMDVVRSAGDEKPEQARSKEFGRVVQMVNGEILLRPHDVAEQGVQVNGQELLRADTQAPIRLRSRRVRQVLASFQGRDIPRIPLEDLLPEIDRIYNAKVTADNEADASGVPRAELVDFVIEYFLETLGSIQAAEERLCSILECVRAAERSSVPVTPKLALFARFLNFCDYERAIPLVTLNIVLQAKRYVNAATLQQKGEAQTAKLKDGRGDPLPFSEPMIPVAAAYNAAIKAMPSTVVAGRRELFSALVAASEADAQEGRSSFSSMKELCVLMLLVQDRIRQQAAPRMRELVHRAEMLKDGQIGLRPPITPDDFRDALLDAGLIGIDDQVWRQKLQTQLMVAGQVPLSPDLILDFLGGGSLHRIPKIHVGETSFFMAVADAVSKEFTSRYVPMQKFFERLVIAQKEVLQSGQSLTFKDVRTTLLQAEPSLSASTVRSIYLTAVEASRCCSQLEGDACPVAGTLEPSPTGLFGSDIVTCKLLSLAAQRHRFLLTPKPSSMSETPQEGAADSSAQVRPSTSTGGENDGRTAASGGRSRGPPSVRRGGR